MKEDEGTYVCQGGECKIQLPPKPIGYLNIPYVATHVSVFTKISWFKKKMLKYFFGITYEKAE